IGVETRFALRLQEALADVVIGARAMQVLRAARGEPCGDAFATTIFRSTCFTGPFLEPRIIVADAVLQAQAAPVDLADLRPAPWRHVEPDQEAVRPAVVLGK